MNFFVAVTLNNEALSTTFFIDVFVSPLQCRLSGSAMHKILRLPSHVGSPLIRDIQKYRFSTDQKHSKYTPSLSEHLTAMSSAGHTPMRAMKKAFKAFARWRKEVGSADALRLDINTLTDALGIELQAEVTRPISCPAPIAFLNSLPSVDLAELTEDSRDCGICAQPMAPLGSLTGDVVKDLHEDAKEEAKRLPCSHVLGLKCLAQWFDPLDPSNNNTCPFCRAVCFRKFPAISTLKGAQARLDAFDWHIQQRGTEATAKEAVQIQILTTIILRDRLVEAFIELEESRAEVDKEVEEQTGVVLATYKGPGRVRCSTMALALFFTKQLFLQALTTMLGSVQVEGHLEDDAEALIEYLFRPESADGDVY